MGRIETIGDATLILGDCLEILPTLGKVDAVVTDPPYGKTACAWDSIIPLQPMWKALGRIVSAESTMLFFGSQPFTTSLINSNLKAFRYEIIYEKTNAKGFLSAPSRPLAAHENILVFGKAETYNPQRWKIPEHLRIKRNALTRKSTGESYGRSEISRYEDDGTRHPTSVVGFSNHRTTKGSLHPNRKPLDLMLYLVSTYSNEGDVVLDFTMGSGTTGVACVELGRKFIGIEIDEKYFDTACERISRAERQGDFFRNNNNEQITMTGAIS